MQSECVSPTAALIAGAAKAFGLPLGVIAPEVQAPGTSARPTAPSGGAAVDWTAVDPHELGPMYLASVATEQRQAAGAFYTPPEVARLLAQEAVPLAMRSGTGPPVCLDPACGCGSLLIEAMRCLCGSLDVPLVEAAQHLRGYDRDPGSVWMARLALVITAQRLGARGVELRRVADSVARHLTVRDALLEPPAESADCVLMNPPYVRAARARRDRERIRRMYQAASGAFDLHVPFVEMALRCLRPGGAFGLLTTSKLLTADYARKLRLMLADGVALERVIDLEHCSGGSGPLVSQVVLTGTTQRAQPAHSVEVTRPGSLQGLADGTAPRTTRRQTELLRERWPSVRASPAEARIIRQIIEGGARRLGELAPVRGGLRGFDYGRCCEALAEASDCPEAMPVLTPGNIHAYRAPTGTPLRLAGREWREPCLPERPRGVTRGLWELFARPKLVVKGVGARPTAAWSHDPAALLVAVWGVWGEEDLLWAALGLLNSGPAAWLHYQQLATARIPRGSLRIPLAWVAAFPVPRGGTDEIAALARRRVAADRPDEQAALQEQIDAAAARAYDLRAADLELMARAPVRPVQA